MTNCIVCQKSIKSHRIFCSRSCQAKDRQNRLIDDWLTGKISGIKKGGRIINAVRTYLLNETNNSCSKCGWNKINPYMNKVPLEINHIDGNSENNVKENLEVLCPNCHSLTDSWKALNKGKGNKERLRYSGLIK